MLKENLIINYRKVIAEQLQHLIVHTELFPLDVLVVFTPCSKELKDSVTE